MADQQTSRTKPRPSQAVNAFKPLGRRAALRAARVIARSSVDGIGQRLYR